MTDEEKALFDFLEEIFDGSFPEDLEDLDDIHLDEEDNGLPDIPVLTEPQTSALEKKLNELGASGLTAASFKKLLQVKTGKPSVLQAQAIACYVSGLPDNTPEAIVKKCSAIKRVLETNHRSRSANKLSKQRSSDKSTDIIAWYVGQGTEEDQREAVRQVLASGCAEAIKSIMPKLEWYVGQGTEEDQREAVRQVLASRCPEAIKTITAKIGRYVDQGSEEDQREAVRQVLASGCGDAIKKITITGKIGWYVVQGSEEDQREAVCQVLASQCVDAIKTITAKIGRYVDQGTEEDQREAVRQVLASQCGDAIKKITITGKIGWYIGQGSEEDQRRAVQQVVVSRCPEAVELLTAGAADKLHVSSTIRTAFGSQNKKFLKKLNDERIIRYVNEGSPEEQRDAVFKVLGSEGSRAIKAIQGVLEGLIDAEDTVAGQKAIQGYCDADKKPRGNHKPLMVAILKSRAPDSIMYKVLKKLLVTVEQLKAMRVTRGIGKLTKFIENRYELVESRKAKAKAKAKAKVKPKAKKRASAVGAPEVESLGESGLPPQGKKRRTASPSPTETTTPFAAAVAAHKTVVVQERTCAETTGEEALDLIM